MKKFKDSLHQDLIIGDLIISIMPYSGSMDIAEILGFTPKMIKVKSTTSTATYRKFPKDVIKFNEQMAAAKNNNPEFYI